MKKMFVTLLVIMITGKLFAQFTSKDPAPKWVGMLRVDSFLWVDTKDTTGIIPRPGTIVMRRQPGDTSLYVANGIKFIKVGESSTIDSVRRSNDTLYFRQKPSGDEIAIKIDNIPQANIIGLPDSLLNKPTLSAADARYKPITYDARTTISATSPITYNSSTGNIGWNGTTSNVPEGMNLYFSNARVQSYSDTRYTPLTRELSTGTGMTGGGDLSADRSFGLDFSYLDDRYLSGYKQRAAVRVATTANITLSGLQTIDGVSVAAGDRVLVKNQTSGAQNGIYNAATGSWTRATDFDAVSVDEVAQGSQIFVSEGTVNNKTGWSLATGGTIVLNTTPLTFIQYSGANSYEAGTGLTLSGNSFSAQTTANLWNANKLQGVNVTTTAPTNGQLLRYDGTTWSPWTSNYLTGELDLISQSKTVSLTAGTGIGITGGTQTVGSNPAFTITNTLTLSDIGAVPQSPSNTWSGLIGATTGRFVASSTGAPNANNWYGIHMPGDASNSAQLAFRDGAAQFRTQAAGVTGAWTPLADRAWSNTNFIQNQNSSAQASSNFYISGSGVMNRLAVYGAVGTFTGDLVFSEGSPAGANGRWRFIRTGGEAAGNVGSNLELQSLDNSGAQIGTPFKINRASGEITLGTINNESTDVDKFLVSNTGSVRYRTGAQVLSDIGAAPASGSGNYIQNQLSSPQTAAFFINGTAAASAIKTNQLNGNIEWSIYKAGSSLANADLRWSVYKSGTESTGNVGSDFNIGRYSDAGTYLSSPIVINRATGMVTMSTGFRAGPSSGIVGTGTTTNNSTLGFYQSDAATRDGYIGLVNKNAYLISDAGLVALRAGTAAADQLVVGPNTVNVASGLLNLTNSTSNFLQFPGVGLSTPSFASRSVGTRIVLSPNLGPSSTDYAIGMESSNMWFSASGSGGGFKWYAGTANIANLRGTGDFELAGQVRARGWSTAGTGAGLEMGVNTGAAGIQAYDRTAGQYLPLNISAGDGAVGQNFRIDNAYHFNIAGTEAVTISQGILSVGNNSPSTIRASPLQVQGNAWATDAWILGTGTTPTAEFGLTGTNSAFIRTMGTGDINFQTSAGTVRAKVNGTTGYFEVPLTVKAGALDINSQASISGSGLAYFSAVNAPTAEASTYMRVGALYTKTRTMNGNGSINSDDYTINLASPSGTGGSYTLTLPNPATQEGRELEFWAGSGLGIWTTNYSITVINGPVTNSITGGEKIKAIGGVWKLLYKSDY